MKKFRNCALHETDSNNWESFVPMTCRELSDFQSWAMYEAFQKMGLKSESGHNCWYWEDGKLVEEIYKGENPSELYELCQTANGIFFMRYFVMWNDDWKQRNQYRIQMI